MNQDQNDQMNPEFLPESLCLFPHTIKPSYVLQRQLNSSWCCQFLTFCFSSVAVLFLLYCSSVPYICECIFHFHHIASALGFSFQFFCFLFCFGFFCVVFFGFVLLFFSFFFFFFLLFFSPHSPGCLVPSTATAAADDATHTAPQPPPPSLPPSFSQALLRSPLPSLPYLFSPSCLSYSLLSATLGASRGIVMPAASTAGFAPIIATPTPVKSDVPLVQDAAGNTFFAFSPCPVPSSVPTHPPRVFSLHLWVGRAAKVTLCLIKCFWGPIRACSCSLLTQ